MNFTIAAWLTLGAISLVSVLILFAPYLCRIRYYERPVSEALNESEQTVRRASLREAA